MTVIHWISFLSNFHSASSKAASTASALSLILLVSWAMLHCLSTHNQASKEVGDLRRNSLSSKTMYRLNTFFVSHLYKWLWYSKVGLFSRYGVHLPQILVWWARQDVLHQMHILLVRPPHGFVSPPRLSFWGMWHLNPAKGKARAAKMEVSNTFWGVSNWRGKEKAQGKYWESVICVSNGWQIKLSMPKGRGEKNPKTINAHNQHTD